MRRVLFWLLVVGSLADLRAAQQPAATAIARPDFSGTWKIASSGGANIPLLRAAETVRRDSYTSEPWPLIL